MNEPDDISQRFRDEMDRIEEENRRRLAVIDVALFVVVLLGFALTISSIVLWGKG